MTTKEIPFTVKKKFDYENNESLKEQATDFADALNVLTQTVSPQMLSAIAEFIKKDGAFAEFLKNTSPTSDTILGFVKHLAKNYASKLGISIKSLLGF